MSSKSQKFKTPCPHCKKQFINLQQHITKKHDKYELTFYLDDDRPIMEIRYNDRIVESHFRPQEHSLVAGSQWINYLEFKTNIMGAFEYTVRVFDEDYGDEYEDYGVLNRVLILRKNGSKLTNAYVNYTYTLIE